MEMTLKAKTPPHVLLEILKKHAVSFKKLLQWTAFSLLFIFSMATGLQESPGSAPLSKLLKGETKQYEDL